MYRLYPVPYQGLKNLSEKISDHVKYRVSSVTYRTEGDEPFGKEARMRHEVTINISDDHGRTKVLKGAQRRLPARLLRWLFGGYEQVYLLSPGKTVSSVDVRELEEK